MVFGRAVAQFRLFADASPVFRTVEFISFSKAISSRTDTCCQVAEAVRPRSANAKSNRPARQHELVMLAGVGVNPEEVVVAASQAMMVRF